MNLIKNTYIHMSWVFEVFSTGSLLLKTWGICSFIKCFKGFGNPLDLDKDSPLLSLTDLLFSISDLVKWRNKEISYSLKFVKIVFIYNWDWSLTPQQIIKASTGLPRRVWNVACKLLIVVINEFTQVFILNFSLIL